MKYHSPSVDPTLIVLSASFLAAATAAFGALPLVGRAHVPKAWIGWANALAGGLMLGSAYALSETGLALDPLAAALGAAVGVLFTYATHRAADVEDLDLNKLHETEPTYGAKVLLVSFLHSASEGVAIGVAMAVDLKFGIFMAVAIAVHNIPEATILCAVLRGRGVRLSLGSTLAVAMNSGQVLLAVTVFAIVSAASGATPAVLGFAFGTLIYLVLVEMLPDAYRQAGPTTIAVLTSLAMGVLILLHGALG
jgi:zinc transporter ZupT